MSQNSDTMRGIPPGVLLIRSIRGKDWSLSTYRYVILLVTFIAYTCYHASRKTSGMVKSVLYPDPHRGNGLDPCLNYRLHKGWSPFNGTDGTSKVGEIYPAFLACYSLGMYVAGHLGDTLDLRLFLTTGMIGSGIFVALFGMGYFLNIHVFGFYLGMQMIAGLFQATGWPSNWFGNGKRGLIMGIWNAHTSVGNISDSLLAASVLDYGWGWCFVVPGAFIAVGGVIVFFFLAAYPEDIGSSFPPNSASNLEAVPDDEEANMKKGFMVNGIGLIEACMIPGVIPFALCLFFSKLYVSVKSAGNLSTLFAVGGIVGGILAGYISDNLNARATSAAGFMSFAIPAMLLYRKYGSISNNVNITLMMVAGLFINGPYALITTAVSADLGTHSSLRGDSRALATVTAIIDGTGSVGAAFGPLLSGFLSTKEWDAVFLMLMICALIATLLLSRLVIAEISEKMCKPVPVSSGQQSFGAPASQPLLRDQR
ncbi:glycerol-3-phosphate transporter 4 [Pyrus ussuriensis x Pyrus communis]|uniref:Glycerol-3-phosphate transporter 4 n=1 Tax=Pyrus ussuriensis x Pyrus communis TaxID=2448454 RepID=A0A5N5HHX5_9ROSA|nr:glycerol-3-phosphate transporter 4 [Pyrus ussuriensis x Pyrus communis]